MASIMRRCIAGIFSPVLAVADARIHLGRQLATIWTDLGIHFGSAWLHRSGFRVRKCSPDRFGRKRVPLIPSPDSIVQEIALYVLVRRNDRWWIASAQNTPVMFL